MQEIIEKQQCTGCGACMATCPKNSITMQMDEEGFDYPVINQKTCIDCGLCQKVCPPLHFEERQENRKRENIIQRGYAARNKNYEERLVSSSGSIFAVLAHQILDQGGYVVGVAYDEHFNAVYKVIADKHELPAIQGSKYLQCKADRDTFIQIRDLLRKGKKVLFSGLACQVEGLRTFLRRDYENLYCVDLICMGIPSPYVWQMYLKTYFPKEVVKAVNFKEKSTGWNSFKLAITTNKQDFKQFGYLNPYFKSMFNTYNMRRSCFICPFKKMERAADITLADCWGASRLVPEIDDNKGLSTVIVHSEKGFQLWNSLSPRIDERELPLSDLVSGNTNMVENKVCDMKGRMRFYSLLNKGKYNKAFHFAENNGKSQYLILHERVKSKLRRVLKFVLKR